MAIISKIRKRSGLLVILIGIAIAGFVLQDAFFGRNNTQKIPPLAIINGEDVSYAQFEQKVEELTAQYRRAQGEDIDITPEDMDQIRKMAWERMLSDMLLLEAAENAGLHVTKEEMNDMYYGKFISNILYNYFTNPQTGVYDRQQVMMIINNFDQMSPEDKKTLSELEKVVKSERLKEKYYLMIAQSFYMPKAIAEIRLHDQMDDASARYVCFDYAEISDADTKITDADYKKYYDENKHLFKQKASRAVDFVVFDVKPTAEDLQEINKNVESLYAEFQTESDVQDFVNTVSSVRFDSIYMTRAMVYPGWDSILFNASPGAVFAPRQIGKTFQMAKLLDVAMRPDSVKASHILISYKDAGSPTGRSKEQAKVLADSIQNVLNKNIAEFAILAQTYSEDPSVQQNGGDLSWQKEGFLIKPFNDAILKGSIGSTTVVETPSGYHVLYITGKTPAVKKVLAAVVSVPIEPSSKTTKSVYTVANRFAAENRTTADFEAAVKKQGLQKRTSEYTEELASALPGLNAARDLVRWAYNEETKVGDVAKEIFEYENKYVIATLREIREEGFMSMESIKKNPQVEYVVKRDKKAEQLIAKINAMGKISSLEAFAAKENKTVDSANNVGFMAYGFGDRGYEPELVGRMFGMKINQISKPLQGNSGVYVMQLDAMNVVPAEGGYEFIEVQAKNAFEQGMGAQVRGALEKAAEITDNRAFYF